GFSIGTLYEYVRTKEDVLSLVYEAINDRVYNHLKDSLQLKEVTLENLYRAIDSYYRLIDAMQDRKSTRLNSSHVSISYAVFCLSCRLSSFTLFPYTTLFRSWF